MSKKMQTYTRSTHYDQPLHCHLCGHLILSNDDAEFSREYSETLPSPCKHTLYVSHSEGYEYLSDRVKTQLNAKNYKLDSDDFFLTISDKRDEDVAPHELSKILEFSDGLNIESIVGAPSKMSVFVGIAPIDDE